MSSVTGWSFLDGGESIFAPNKNFCTLKFAVGPLTESILCLYPMADTRFCNDACVQLFLNRYARYNSNWLLEAGNSP